MPALPHLTTTPSSNPHPNLSAILTSFQKRSSSDCSYYETSCGTHRLAIMIIIICVGIMVSAILSTLYIRSHRHKAAKLRTIEQQHQRMKMNHEGWPSSIVNEARYAVPQGAPPPYEPRRPDRVARVDGEWR
ncbi:hypothetical protein BKA63DRAFT_488675 [Paraphoma chrysanthemicola]|nr:hypothetical protein BKA63DRAFT_488675 [Paraphoma chrysanthemicola]